MKKPFTDIAGANDDVRHGHQLFACLLRGDRPRYSVDPARVTLFADTLEQGGPRAVRALFFHKGISNADKPYVFRAAAFAILNAGRPNLLDVLIEGYESIASLYEQDMCEIAVDLVKRVDVRDEHAGEIQAWLKASRYKDRAIDVMLSVTVNRGGDALSRLDDFLRTVGDRTSREYFNVLQARLASEPVIDNYTGGRNEIIPMLENKICRLEQYLANPPAAQPWIAAPKVLPPADAAAAEAKRVIHAPRIAFKRKR